MNTKKAATNNSSCAFEESARRGSVDFIFCGIHTLKFIDHSNRVGKDLAPFPTRGMEAVAPDRDFNAPLQLANQSLTSDERAAKTAPGLEHWGQ